MKKEYDFSKGKRGPVLRTPPGKESIEPRAPIVIEHDPDCPLGKNGLRAHAEAAEALSSTPPEARATAEDMARLTKAWSELEAKQVCRCGASDRSRIKRP
jgi:hypothetical protein